MHLGLVSALIACASVFEVTVLCNCSQDFEGYLASSGTLGTGSTIPAGGQTTFFPDNANGALWVTAVGDATITKLVDFEVNDDGTTSFWDITVNAPSLAPGVGLTPSGSLEGTCNMINCGTSYGPSSTFSCPSGTIYAIDICLSNPQPSSRIVRH